MNHRELDYPMTVISPFDLKVVDGLPVGVIGWLIQLLLTKKSRIN